MVIILTALSFINADADNDVSAFDFSDPASLNPSINPSKFTTTDGSRYSYYIDGITFTDNPFMISVADPNNIYDVYKPKLYKDVTNGYRLNTFPNTEITISTSGNYYIASAQFTFISSNQRQALKLQDEQIGSMSENIDGVQTFTPNENERLQSLIVEYLDNNNAPIGVKKITVYYNSSDLSDINDVDMYENSPIEYYNLQGIRIIDFNCLAPGLYIRRQGSISKLIKIN